MMRCKFDPSIVVLRFRPMQKWTHGTGPKNYRCPFLVQPSKTRVELKHEMAMIGSRECIIEAELGPSDIRLDGEIRAGANANPGRVIISFIHPKAGSLIIPCWAFSDLWDNIRAVTKYLESLRAADRYGVAKHYEHYTGWSALPPPSSAIIASEFATVEDAMRFLIKTAAPGLVFGPETVRDAILTPGKIAKYFRCAAQAAHPDMPGGSNELMRKVNAARDMIEREQKGCA